MFFPRMLILPVMLLFLGGCANTAMEESGGIPRTDPMEGAAALRQSPDVKAARAALKEKFEAAFKADATSIEARDLGLVMVSDLFYRQRYEEGEALSLRLLGALKKRHGAASWPVLRFIAVSSDIFSQYKRAYIGARLAGSFILSAKKSPPANPRLLPLAYSLRGIHLFIAGYPDAALRNAEKATALHEKNKSILSRDAIFSLDIQSAILAMNEQPEKAEKLFRQADERMRRGGLEVRYNDFLNLMHQSVAVQVHMRKGDWPAATRAARKKEALTKARFGAASIATAQAQLQLGWLLLLQGDVDEAEPLLANAGRILGRKLGPQTAAAVSARKGLNLIERYRSGCRKCLPPSPDGFISLPRLI